MPCLWPLLPLRPPRPRPPSRGLLWWSSYETSALRLYDEKCLVVDTTATSGLRFLAANQLNVGISHARAGLYIVGGWKQLSHP